jgi:hypothetical protein
MKETHLLLLVIISILLFMTIKDIYQRFDQQSNSHLNNDEPPVYLNDSTYNNDTNLLVPTKDMIYNPNDIHRPNNDLPIQEESKESVSESDKLSIMVNTSGNTPLVYSLDELTHTVSHLPPTTSPSGYIPIEIDTGSGDVSRNTIVNNNNLNLFNSIN